MRRQRVEPTVQPGVVITRFSKQEIAALVARWLEVFGAERFGVNARAYMWHVFCGERYPSVSGRQAQAEYEQCEAPEYVVLSNDRDLAFSTDLRPVQASLRDFLVFPVNLAWTMAFTHEDGYLGPYFARNADFARLNEANMAAVRKKREVENARLRGWI